MSESVGQWNVLWFSLTVKNQFFTESYKFFGKAIFPNPSVQLYTENPQTFPACFPISPLTGSGSQIPEHFPFPFPASSDPHR